MAYSPPGSSACGTLQARVLEWNLPDLGVKSPSSVLAIEFCFLFLLPLAPPEKPNWNKTRTPGSFQFISVAQSCLTLCDPMDCSTPRPPCPSPTPGVYSNSRLLNWWCHATISSSVVPFSSCPQSFPASGSFQMSQFFTSGGQSIGVLASTSVLPMNSPKGLISFRMDWLDHLGVKGILKSLLQHHSSKASILQLSAFFIVQLTSIRDHWKNHRLD